MSHGWAPFTYTTLPWKSLAASFLGREREGREQRERKRDFLGERERVGSREREREREREISWEREKEGREQ